MPQFVIDLLEMVEVDQKCGAFAIIEPGGAECLVKKLGHAPAVEQTGERIKHRQPRVFICIPAVVGYISANAAKSQEFRRCAELGLPRNPPTAGFIAKLALCRHPFET
jgi:ribosomal protein S14